MDEKGAQVEICDDCQFQIQLYLDGVIRHWRRKRDRAQSRGIRLQAMDYIDAYQSARVSLTGSLLPAEEKD